MMSTVAAEVPTATPPRVRWTGRTIVRRALFAALVAVLLVVVTNLQIMGLSLVLQETKGGTAPVPGIDGVDNLRALDAKVWRSAKPKPEAYPLLAAAGVTTVVDLRAERYAYVDDLAALAAGLDVVHLPVRDGQPPSDEQVSAFLAEVERAPGTVLVHCGAGVGRTGSMASAYLVATGQSDALDTVIGNLAVGPPSVEQLWWMGTAGADVPVPVVVVSRILDAPRRLLSGR